MSVKRDEQLFVHSCRTDSAQGVCRTRGGESCAFDGAMIVLQCIADCAHLVHGPIACAGNSYESRGTLSHKGILHRRSYTTDIGELDIVYGAEQRLFKAIELTIADARPQAVFVYATCVTGLIGEDVRSVCRRATESFGIPVIPVEAPGFVGPKNLGNRIAGDVLLEFVIGTQEPPLQTPTDIVLVGEYNIAGDLDLVEPLFQRAGIRILSRITGNASYSEVCQAHRARATGVVCGRALINVARELEVRYGIPFREISFYGRTEMSRALRSMAEMLAVHDPAVIERVESVIRDEEASLQEELRRYDHLKGKRAVLYTGGVKSWSIIQALMDLGIEVVAVGTKKSTYEDEEKMKAILGPDAPLYENISPAMIRKLIREEGADMLIAGGRNLYLAIKEGIPFVDVNQERHLPYAGYAGLLNLAGEISQSIQYYEREKRANAPIKREVEKDLRPVLINPLKHSMSIGAAIAFQGIDRASVVMHGAQGCNFLGKVLLTAHFKDPVSLNGTKLFVEDVVMGGADRLRDTLRETESKERPDLIAVVTSGLAEVRGEDIVLEIREAGISTPVVHVPTPDYSGGLEEGYVAAVLGLLGLIEPVADEQSFEHASRKIILLPGSSLTPGDVNELQLICEDFGLNPVCIPDTSCLDGSRAGHSPISVGGVAVSELKGCADASFAIAAGASMAPAAERLLERHRIPFEVFACLSNLNESDRLFTLLERISGRPTPSRYERQRRVLRDGMRDMAVRFGRKRVMLAMDAERALQFAALLRPMGACVEAAIIPVATDYAGQIDAERVIVGDLATLEERARLSPPDLIIANSHGRQAAERLSVPVFEWGFPAFEQPGFNSSVSIGYRGVMDMLCRIAGQLAH